MIRLLQTFFTGVTKETSDEELVRALEECLEVYERSMNKESVECIAFFEKLLVEYEGTCLKEIIESVVQELKEKMNK